MSVSTNTLVAQRSESTHHRLYEFAKTALIKIFVHPYVTVCDLYCGGLVDAEKWESAQIGHYVGIDVSSSGVSELKEAWQSQRKNHTADFFEADPCSENFEMQLQEKANQADLVCCLQNLQLCFETEESARKLLHNVSSLLKPGGYFFGITPDSSTIWAKYQKNVEAYHNRSGSMKPNIVPNCIRSESYMITFEVEEEKFPLFGKKYQLKFAHEMSAETHCLVHFPSLIRLAREAGLEYVEIQNLTEFYDDNRAHFEGMLINAGPNLVDARGRLLPRSFDILGLYSTFIFQKPDPDAAPPLATPLLQEDVYNHDEKEWHSSGYEENSIEPLPPGMGKMMEPPPPGVGKMMEPPPPGMGKMMEPPPPGTGKMKEPPPPGLGKMMEPPPPGLGKMMEPLPPGLGKMMEPLPPGLGKMMEPLPPGMGKMMEPPPPGMAKMMEPLPPGLGKMMEPPPPGLGKMMEPPPPGMGKIMESKAIPLPPSAGLGKISEQKGILGPGPADLRFSDAQT